MILEGRGEEGRGDRNGREVEVKPANPGGQPIQAASCKATALLIAFETSNRIVHVTYTCRLKQSNQPREQVETVRHMEKWVNRPLYVFQPP